MTNAAPRHAVAAVFVLHGLLFASWVAHIPTVKGNLHLSNPSLGLALLGVPAGAVALTAASGRLLPRYGSRLLCQVGVAGYCVTGPFVGLAGSLPELFLALFGWGAFQGMLDVAMNAQAVAVEVRQDRRIMAGLHGGYSVGALLGAVAGTAGVAAGLSLAWQLLLLGVIAAAVGMPATLMMVSDVAAPESPVRQHFSGALVALGVVAFASMLCEGAAADWSAVYLRDGLGTAAATGGLAYLTFAVAMVAVRLGGNRLTGRYGERRLVPALAGVAAVGFGVALGVDVPAAAFAGFACLGAGLGLVVPMAYAAAGRLGGLPTVVAVGTAGFVAGPAIIGGLAGAGSLRAALVLLPVLSAVIVLVTLRTPPVLRRD